MTRASGDPGPAASGARRSRVARAIVPWLVAAGCLAYAFQVVPIDACVEALQGGQQRAAGALGQPLRAFIGARDGIALRLGVGEF